jgi:hypothetical protein
MVKKKKEKPPKHFEGIPSLEIHEEYKKFVVQVTKTNKKNGRK